MFCQAVIERDSMIMTLAGETGTAKTRTLRWIYRAMRVSGVGLSDRRRWKITPSITFVEWSDIATEDKRDNDLLFTEAVECDLLLLDDIGSEIDKFKTNEPKERLRRLLGARDGKHTAITTNIPQDRWNSVWDDRVEDRLLRGNAVVVDLFGIPRFSEVE